jgi:hypothetical protein
MSELVYVAQTFEPDHCASRKTHFDWWEKCHREGVAKGATWFRFSWDDKLGGLLIEGWESRPANEGDPRWSFAAKEPSHD